MDDERQKTAVSMVLAADNGAEVGAVAGFLRI